jgi:hypothetical protein
MTAADEMAIILFLFFLVGVAVGVLAVITLSARRAHNAVRYVPPRSPAWPYGPGRDPDESDAPGPPRWPTRGSD